MKRLFELWPSSIDETLRMKKENGTSGYFYRYNITNKTVTNRRETKNYLSETAKRLARHIIDAEQ